MAKFIWEIVRTRGTVLIGKFSNSSGDVSRRRCAGEKIKVAVIDLNKTLIVSKSGFLHGVDENDWKWWDDNVPIRLRALHDQGYVIVITSNQGRLTDTNGDESAEAKPFKMKMELILKDLGASVTLIVACANDIYRKPRPGIWSLIPNFTGNEGLMIDNHESFVVGDAAGRKKDHSDSDLHLALNLGLDFYTPEIFFQDQAQEPLGHKFDPSSYLTPHRNDIYDGQEFMEVQADDLAMTPATIADPRKRSLNVFIGLPGAGKTTFYNHFLAPLGYKRVKGGDLGALDDSEGVADGCLREGLSVVIDDSNIDNATRKPWISLARKHRVKAQAFYFTTPADLCLHNDSFRALAGLKCNPEHKPIFPRILFLDLVSRLEKPRANEGFDRITDIDFVWHGTEEELEIWRRYWH